MRLVTDEADAVLAILAKRAAGAPIAETDWRRLYSSEGYTRLKRREEAMKRLEGFRLDGVVQRITCPFLLVHGEGDEQIPLQIAQKCFDAVGAKNKTLKVFSREEGGYHHCQIDNVSIGVAYMWDWVEGVLKSSP